jgi:hypothetical protein
MAPVFEPPVKLTRSHFVNAVSQALNAGIDAAASSRSVWQIPDWVLQEMNETSFLEENGVSQTTDKAWWQPAELLGIKIEYGHDEFLLRCFGGRVFDPLANL